MSIGFHFDDIEGVTYDPEVYKLIDENKRLREVIRNTYLTVDRIADEKIWTANHLSDRDDATTADKLESVDIRGQALGNKQANIQLMRFLIQFGFDNDTSLIR